MPTLSILVCTTENGIIGNQGKMLELKKRADYQRFKSITTNHYQIMGRKSYVDMIEMLKKFGSVEGEMGSGRHGIILTNSTEFKPAPDCIVVHSLQETLEAAKNTGEDEVIISGGQQIYDQFLPLCNRIYLTKLHTIAEGDASFNIPNPEEWKTVYEEKFPADEKNEFDYTFYTLERINPVEL